MCAEPHKSAESLKTAVNNESSNMSISVVKNSCQAIWHPMEGIEAARGRILEKKIKRLSTGASANIDIDEVTFHTFHFCITS